MRRTRDYRPRTSRRPATAGGLAALTEREGDVLAGLCAGLRDKEIAERLVLSPATVATHVRSIASKLGVRSRLEIVVHTFTQRRAGD